MNFKKEELEARLVALAEPLAESMGFELVDVAYVMEHGWVLRVFLDKPGGITVDDCGEFSREFSTILDVEDPIHHSYVLEVSSPGLDRPLVREKDFVKYIGRKARIRSRVPIDGRRNFKAVIDSAAGGRVEITDFDGRRFSIEISNIEKAKLEIEL